MIKLSDFPTRAPEELDRETIKKKTKRIAKQIAELQEKLVAQGNKSLLIVFQGMDTSGKDGSTHAVFGRCTPSGIKVKSFKKPSEEEFAHDFLWRAHKATPAKGEIAVFIRSHYEDVLIQRVHQWIDEDRVDARIEAINAFETLLEKDNNTKVLKFYMHLSKERQLEKLQERIDIPDKNYKHNPGDWEERKLWDKYMECYEDVINRSKIPWIIAPVDQRWYRNYFIANKVLEALTAMELEYPVLENR